ncbi:hypothetical protein DL96DRAFT_1453307, partial [Flagelloscypha sp. PMI_526]
DAIDQIIPDCDDKWKNLSDSTFKSWGQYDETGTVNCYCRHAALFAVCDMVKSGELTKYSFALMHRLLTTFGKGILLGYDIGCGIDVRKNRDPVVGPLADKLGLRCCVGAFHGHAHNRICQLKYLISYIVEAGIDPLETCESAFAVTNAAARAVRYSTAFHRSQLLNELYKHENFHTSYGNISSFIVGKYRQAWKTLASIPEFNAKVRTFNNGAPIDFAQNFKDELTHLLQTKKKTLNEIDELHVQYTQFLDRLWTLETELRTLALEFQATPPHLIILHREIRVAYLAKEEQWQNVLLSVQHHEKKLGIAVPERWTPSSPSYTHAKSLHVHREYLVALTELEGLIVARMQELTKANMSDTGYNQRQKIGQAIKKRSGAVQTAVNRVNRAAKVLWPERPPLEFKEVVNYAFLSEFDFLRATGSGVIDETWAHPIARRLADEYYRIKSAQHELQRLNVETKRLITYMWDEELILKDAERSALDDDKDPLLAFAISRKSRRLAPLHKLHRQRLSKVKTHPWFQGSLEPGI